MKTNKRLLPRLAAAALCLVLMISSSAAEQTAEDLLSVFTVNNGPRDSKKIAITMDDVYEPEWVWKSVELCRQYGITMTYFPIGINLKEEDRDNWRAPPSRSAASRATNCSSPPRCGSATPASNARH